MTDADFTTPGRKRYRPGYDRRKFARAPGCGAFRRFGGVTPLTVAEHIASERRDFPRPLRFHSTRRFDKWDAPMYDGMQMLRCGQISRLGGVLGLRARIRHQIWLRNYRAYCRDPSAFGGNVGSLSDLQEDPWRGPR